jgi:hypothetical protein
MIASLPLPVSGSSFVRRIGGLLALMIGLHPEAGHAAPSAPVRIEVQGQFLGATKSQLAVAWETAHIDPQATVLTPGQSRAARAAMAKAGVETFSQSRAITGSGRQADSEAGKEFHYASKYEPSKTDAGKFVATNFEMRLVGVTMRVEPTATANGGIRLEATCTVTRFLGFVDYGNIDPGAKSPPPLEDLLKAPLHEGAVWQPFFATFTETRTFDLPDGGTAVMAGAEVVEPRNPPAGQPALQSRAPAAGVVVFLTARKILPN